MPAKAPEDEAPKYVQVMPANIPSIPNMPTKPGFNPAQAMEEALHSQLRDRIHDFIAGVIRGALSHASPLLGMLADTVASKLEESVMEHALPTIHLKDMKVSSTTTISSQRTRVDYEHISIIAQCDAGKLITMNRDAKTYFVTSLDSSDELTRSALAQSIAPSQVHIDRQPDDQVQTIAGMQAHHEVETFSAPGIPSASQDKWYALSDMTNGCSESGQTMSGNIEIPLRLERKVDLSTLPFQMPKTNMPGFDLAEMLTTRVETTSVNKILYDPTFFDVPAGFTRVPPPGVPASPGPPVSPSS